MSPHSSPNAIASASTCAIRLARARHLEPSLRHVLAERRFSDERPHPFVRFKHDFAPPSISTSHFPEGGLSQPSCPWMLMRSTTAKCGISADVALLPNTFEKLPSRVQLNPFRTT